MLPPPTMRVVKIFPGPFGWKSKINTWQGRLAKRGGNGQSRGGVRSMIRGRRREAAKLETIETRESEIGSDRKGALLA